MTKTFRKLRRNLIRLSQTILISSLIVGGQAVHADDPPAPPITPVKKGVSLTVPFDGFLMPRSRAEKLDVMAKDFATCQTDRSTDRLKLSQCEQKAEVYWWNSTYFKVTLGIFLGYALAKVEGKYL